MPRRSIPSSTLVAAVRRHFGLEQQELAAYLGVSRVLLANIEAGRRALTSQLLLRLAPLAALVPDAPAANESTLPPTGPAAPAPLLARLDYCLQHARLLRRELRGLAQQLARARRWQQVLPGLLAAAPVPDEGPARQWLLARHATTAPGLDADDTARYHLLRLRAEALETEAAALAALLAPQPSH
jgi:transcriptional regulator with XRE-family HTH domain